MNHIREKKVKVQKQVQNVATEREYNKALKEIGNSHGLLQTAQQARSMENLTVPNTKLKELEIVKNGPMEKYESLLPKKEIEQKSLSNRNTENFLLNKVDNSVSVQEKFLKFNQMEQAKLLDKYNNYEKEIPIESFDYKKNYDKIKQKEKTLEGQIKNLKEDIKIIKSEIAINQVIRASHAKIIDGLIQHFKPELEKNQKKAEAILEEFKQFNLSEPLEDINISKLKKDENYNRIKDLKEKYERINYKIQLIKNHVKDKEKELNEMDKGLKDRDSLLSKKYKAIKANESRLERFNDEEDRLIANSPYSRDAFLNLIDIITAYDKNKNDREAIEEKLAKAKENLETLRTEIGYSKLASQIISQLR